MTVRNVLCWAAASVFAATILGAPAQAAPRSGLDTPDRAERNHALTGTQLAQRGRARGHRRYYRRPPVRRLPARPPIYARRPIYRAPRVVVRTPGWRGARWGAIAFGVTLGAALVVAANTPPPPPDPSLCWTWLNPTRTQGYWYYCSGY